MYLNLTETRKHIEKVRGECESILEAASVIEEKTINISEAWRDDVYRGVALSLCELNMQINRCVETCSGIIDMLSDLYRRAYIEYLEQNDFDMPAPMQARSVSSQRLEDSIRSTSDVVYVTPDDLDQYGDALQMYRKYLLDAFQSIFESQKNYGEYFVSRRYEEMTAELADVFRSAVSILDDLEQLAVEVHKKAEWLRTQM